MKESVKMKKKRSILTLSSLRKYGLHADKTTLCAVKLLLSQASVTSTKSSSSLKFRNVLRILEWKSFHLSEYCCSPLDEDEEAAMASVPSGPTAEGIKGAIVLTPRGHPLTSPRFTLLHLFTRFSCRPVPWRFQATLNSSRDEQLTQAANKTDVTARLDASRWKSLIFVDAV